MPNLAAESAGGGLRGNIMRTPGQRQQVFALEGLINEAAAAAKADPIQFRIEHNERAAVDRCSQRHGKGRGMEVASVTHSGARRTGTSPVTGAVCALFFPQQRLLVGIAEVAVTPATGSVRATKFTIGADCGKIINPRQLDRCMKSGVVMGLSEALKEEVTFDKSQVTARIGTATRF